MLLHHFVTGLIVFGCCIALIYFIKLLGSQVRIAVDYLMSDNGEIDVYIGVFSLILIVYLGVVSSGVPRSPFYYYYQEVSPLEVPTTHEPIKMPKKPLLATPHQTDSLRYEVANWTQL